MGATHDQNDRQARGGKRAGKETASEPPDTIYLQWNGDGDPNDPAKVHEPEVTWSRDQIFAGDVAYRRVGLGP